MKIMQSQNIYTDHSYLEHNPDWHEADAPFKAGKIAYLLQKNNISFNTVCEIGCGSGEILVRLSKEFQNKYWTGYDISPDAIKIAKRKENDNFHFELKDITSAEDQSRFDLVLVIDVLEHLNDYFSFLDSIRSKAEYFIFHIPLDMCVWSLLREQMLIESKQRVGHIHNFTEDFILSILRDYGFQEIDHIYTEPLFRPVKMKHKLVSFVRKSLFKIAPKFTTKTLGGYSVMVLAKPGPEV